MKVYIDGKDNVGWSIDSDNFLLTRLIKQMSSSITLTENYFCAEIIHNLWWNSFFSFKKLPMLLKKNILLTASNFIDPFDEKFVYNKQLNLARKLNCCFIAPSTKQLSILNNNNCCAYHFPFLINGDIFSYNEEKNKLEIAKKFGIPVEIFRDRKILGSFQRDSIGKDLSQPKWQKGPDMLVKVLKDLPKDKFILLLAGPRRHYIISQCDKYSIPYYYVGEKTQQDDIFTNTLSLNVINEMYDLLDAYLVVSRSEGGPKAILEATSKKVPIFSTNVGISNDYINKDWVFDDVGSYTSSLKKFIQGEFSLELLRSCVESNYTMYKENNSIDVISNKLIKIYKSLISRK